MLYAEDVELVARFLNTSRKGSTATMRGVRNAWASHAIVQGTRRSQLAMQQLRDTHAAIAALEACVDAGLFTWNAVPAEAVVACARAMTTEDLPLRAELREVPVQRRLPFGSDRPAPRGSLQAVREALVDALAMLDELEGGGR